MATEKQDKVLISIPADADLEEMVREINDGFTGGRISKSQLLSWVVRYFRKNCIRECIGELRLAHFDQLAHLKSVVKDMERAKKSGAADVDLKALLAPVLSKPKSPPRRKVTSAQKPAPTKADRLDLNRPNGKVSDGKIQE